MVGNHCQDIAWDVLTHTPPRRLTPVELTVFGGYRARDPLDSRYTIDPAIQPQKKFKSMSPDAGNSTSHVIVGKCNTTLVEQDTDHPQKYGLRLNGVFAK